MIIIKKACYLLGFPIVLICVWWIVTAQTDSLYFPTPGEISAEIVDTWFGPRFFTDIVPSVYRFLVAVALSIVIGVIFGVAIGSNRAIRDFTEPVLEFFRAVPTPVLLPLFLLLLGVTDTMRIVVIIAGCVWPILLNTIEGVRAVDSVQEDTARTYGLGRLARIRYVVVPSAMPQIMTGIRQSLSIGLILMIISEMFAASSGLGYSIVVFQRTFAIPEMWSGIAILGLIGVLVSLVSQLIERRVLRWYDGLKEVQNAS